MTVTGSGVGIPSDLLPRVFEVVVQGAISLNRSQGGLGIGLSLVRRLVELHGGSLEARSDGTSSGSTFRLRRVRHPARWCRLRWPRPLRVPWSC